MTDTFWCRISTLGGMSLESTTCFRNRINALRGRGICSGCCCAEPGCHLKQRRTRPTLRAWLTFFLSLAPLPPLPTASPGTAPAPVAVAVGPLGTLSAPGRAVASLSSDAVFAWKSFGSMLSPTAAGWLEGDTRWLNVSGSVSDDPPETTLDQPCCEKSDAWETFEARDEMELCDRSGRAAYSCCCGSLMPMEDEASGISYNVFSVWAAHRCTLASSFSVIDESFTSLISFEERADRQWSVGVRR